jgi:hypothetical protein
MKKLSVAAIIICTIIFSACKNEKLTYYNAIVDMHNNIDTAIANIEKVNSKDGSVDSIASVKTIDSLLPKLENAIAAIKKIESPKDDNLLKQNLVDNHIAIRDMMKTLRVSYTVKGGFESMGKDSLAKYMDELTINQTKLHNADSIFTLHLEEYRKANKIELAK